MTKLNTPMTNRQSVSYFARVATPSSSNTPCVTVSKPMGVAQYHLTSAPALPAKLRRELPTTDELAGEFGLLSVVGLRIEIERALRELMERRGIAVPARSTITSMTQTLGDLKLMPGTGEFELAVRTMNSAAHGYDIDANAAQEAFSAGKKFLADVRKLTHDR